MQRQRGTPSPSFGRMEVVSRGTLESISRPSSVKSEGCRESSSQSSRPCSTSCSMSFELEDISKEQSGSSFEVLDVDTSTYVYFPTENLTSASLGKNTKEKKTLGDRDLISESERSFECSTQGDIDDDRTSGSASTVSKEEQLKEGFESIKRLDKILSEKLLLEKQVKAERRLLELQWKTELERLIEERKSGKFSNERKLLALMFTNDIERDYQGSMDEEVNAEAYRPVFATQIDDDDYSEAASSRKFKDAPSSNGTPGKKDDASQSTSKQSSNKRRSGKNFLERNKQLAANAAESIPMTDDEKKRLDELLAVDTDLLVTDNPFGHASETSLAVSAYRHDDNDSIAMTSINEKLRLLLPDSEMDAICCPPGAAYTDTISNAQYSGFAFDTSTSIEDLDISTSVGCGEKVLEEERVVRSLKQRLEAIEKQLTEMHSSESDLMDASSATMIPYDLLQHVIYNDSRCTSTNSEYYSGMSDSQSMISESITASMTAVGGIF